MLRIEDTADGIRCIGLDRAAKRNAIGVEMTLALEAVLGETRHDKAVRAVVFHAIGDHFSAGMDMKDFFDATTRPAELLQRARDATEHWRARLLAELPQVVVSAVRGYCFGGALPILAASDVVLAAPDARFGLPEINFGLMPGAQILKALGMVMTPRGLAHAALSGHQFDADQARRWGLVSEVVAGDLLQAAIARARALVSTADSPALTGPAGKP